jgi:hypothetical protein
MLIRSLQPAVERKVALRKLSPAGPSGILCRWTMGKFLGLGEIYIPYRLYHVKIHDHRMQSSRLLAVDALSAALDPFEFSGPPTQDRCRDIETRNHLPARLAEAETGASVLAKVRRLLFSEGFFRLAKPVISAELLESELYVPYWAGFYGEEKSVGIVMLDAIRGTIEGGKATHSVKAWLLEDSEQRTVAA